MTSLSSQLKRLAVPFASVFTVDADKRRASFLFEPQEAANIDRATFHAIGLNGLEELKQIDSDSVTGFAAFEETLFGEESVSFERLVQSATVNEELDRQISSFLLRLSPHFQLKAAWKALEWLVYRYHIHQMNVDDLLMCVFPYHETNIFVRVVQMINVDSPSSMWHWLKPIQKPGVVLNRITVLNHAAADPSFLAFICVAAKKTVKLFAKSDNPSAGMHPMLSFYASTVAGAIARVDKPTEQFVATVFPYLSRSFKSNVTDYKLSGYMVASQLVLKVKLKGDIVDELIYKIVKGNDPSSDTLQSLLCVMAVIFKAQNISGLKAKTWSLLLKLPNLASGLAQMQCTGICCDQLISTVATAVFRRIFTAASLLEAGSDAMDQDEDEENDSKWLLTLLHEMFITSDMMIDSSLANLLVSNLLNTFCNAFEVDRQCENGLSFFRELLTLISKRHPAVLDDVVATGFNEQADRPAKLDAVRVFSRVATTMGTACSVSQHEILEECGTSLFLALNHATAEVRRLALVKLRDDISESPKENDVDFITKSIRDRLFDDDAYVFDEALNTLKALWSKVDCGDFVEPFRTIIYRKAHLYSTKMRGSAISCLLTSTWSSCDEVQLFWLAAPLYFLPNNSSVSTDELALFSKRHPSLQLSGFVLENSEDELTKLALSLSLDYFPDDLVDSLSQRQLSFACALLATRLFNLKKHSDLAFLPPLVRVLEKQVSLPSSVASSSTTSADLDDGLLDVIQRILAPVSQDHHGAIVDYNCLLVSVVLKKLFESTLFMNSVFDKAALEDGLWSSKNRSTAVGQYWSLTKILLDYCTKASAFRLLFRKVFGVLAKSFFDFNAVLMLRFCVIADRFFSKDEAVSDYQACFLQSIECLLAKSESLPPSLKSLDDDRVLSATMDLLSFFSLKNKQLSKLSLLCMAKLKELGFWSSMKPIIPFIDCLLENKTEVLSSAENVQLVIARYLMSEERVRQTSPAPSSAPLSSDSEVHVSPARRATRRSGASSVATPSPRKSLRKTSTSIADAKSDSSKPLLQTIFDVFAEANLAAVAPWYLNRFLWLIQEANHAVVLPHVVSVIASCTSSAVDVQLASSLMFFYSPSSASQLNDVDKEQTSPLAVLLQLLNPSKSNSEWRNIALQKINGELFAKLPTEESQFAIAVALCSHYICDKSIDLNAKLLELHFSLPLFKRLLLTFVHEISSEVETDNHHENGTRRKRRLSHRTTSVSTDSGVSLDISTSIAKLVMLLECLLAMTSEHQSSSKKNNENAQFLVVPLYDVLDMTLSGFLASKDAYLIKTTADTPADEAEFFSSPDHLRQLCLKCLTNIFSKYHQDDVEFRSTSVLSCLTSSSSLQTLQCALIFIDSVAKRMPETIRKIVSEIFDNICSSGILKCDDPYSARVLRDVASAIVPLISKDFAVTDFTKSPSIPRQSIFHVVQILANVEGSLNNSNCEKLFATLFASCLSPSSNRRIDTMAVCAVLVVCQRLNLHTLDKADAESILNGIERQCHFLTSVVNEIETFSVDDMIELSEQLCSTLQLPQEGEAKELPSAVAVASCLAGKALDVKSSASLYATLKVIRLGVLSFVNRLLAISIEELKNPASSQDEVRSQVCQRLFETVVRLATDDVGRQEHYRISSQHDSASASSSNTPTSSYLTSAYLEEVMTAFEQTNTLLSDVSFIEAARNILADEDDKKESEMTSSQGDAHWKMQMKTLDVLAERLPEIASANNDSLRHQIEKIGRLLIKKLKKSSVKLSIRHAVCQVLTSVARTVSGLVDSSDGQQANVTVECIRNSLEAALSLLKNSSSLKGTADNQKLVGLLLECAATCCVSLGASALASLGSVVGSCLAQLDISPGSFNATQKSSGVSVPSASITALNQLLVAFSSFVSPYITDILCKMCLLKPQVATWNTASSQQSINRSSVELSSRIDEVMDLLSTVHFRLIVPIFGTIYEKLRASSAAAASPVTRESVVFFFRFVSKSVSKWSRDDLLPHLPKLHGFFVMAMDYRFEVRQKENEPSLEVIAGIEDELFESIIAVSMKLTESEMRPLFFKIFDWCSRAIEEGRQIRLITFYRFCVRLADSLKLLFLLFAPLIFTQSIEVLKKTNPSVAENGETLFDDVELDLLLSASVLDMLSLVFANDPGNFTNRTRFDAVESPLVDQLEFNNEKISPETYLNHIKLHAGPAIVALAVAVSDDAAWKIVNQSLLVKTQNSSAEVRLAAVQVLDLLVTRMGDDYSSALPDTVPYLAPLLEDDDETVESACRDLSSKLENVLGEPISKYF